MGDDHQLTSSSDSDKEGDLRCNDQYCISLNIHSTIYCTHQLSNGVVTCKSHRNYRFVWNTPGHLQ